MYVPDPFREEDLPTMQDWIQQNAFALLVTAPGGEPFASHLPFLLDTARGPLGTLRAHLARANPQWQHLADGSPALVVFSGPHAYVSPAWYSAAPSVPTWNYAAVHAYGTARLQDEAETSTTLRESVAQFESGRDSPWPFESLSEEYVGKMQRAIVGFEIEIHRLEGKWKMSQNKSGADVQGAIAGLRGTGRPIDAEVAAQMASVQEARS